MDDSNDQLHSLYSQQGYFVCRRFFTVETVEVLRRVTQSFHESWLKENTEAFQKGAINSAYLTRAGELDEVDRNALFTIVASHQLINLLAPLFPQGIAFMNTQLFFDPLNPKQNNYWHRDPQYHLSAAEQQHILQGSQEVIHCRIPLFDERGIELIPGTHKRWDNDLELRVRMEKDGHRNFDPLPGSCEIELEAGDLLVFSANMIHRGLYGRDRLALDLLYCDRDPELLKFSESSAMPSASTLTKLDNPEIFTSTLTAK